MKLLRRLINIITQYRRKKYEKKLNRVLQVNGIEVLGRFHQAMKSINCEYWLAFGTLLGAIRDKKLISFDTDIDVGVLSNNDFDQIDITLRKFGFEKVRRIEIFTKGNSNERGFELTYTQNGVLIDIFVFDQVFGTNHIYTHTCLWNNTHFRYLSTVLRVTVPFEGTTMYTFQNILVCIPKNYKEYLQSYYGMNYDTPDPHWEPTMSNSVEVVLDAIGILDEYKEA
ncbi:MAG: LicD family protein [Bacteroides eggerthii]|jgi:hypothetical protein